LRAIVRIRRFDTPPEAHLTRRKEKGKRSSEQVYDARGLLCPLPIIRAAERISAMNEGEVLEVISDDPGIQEDMPAWCRSSGHILLDLFREGRDYRSYVRKRRPGGD
jgi:tRNA 2-thiouridine synthesizing protein A